MKGIVVRFRRLIKTILFGIFCSMISNVSLAEQLRCEQDFPKIKRLFLQEKNIYDRGSLTDLLQYQARTNYAELFTVKHQGKVFWGPKWVDRQENTEETRRFFEMYQKDRHTMTITVGRPTENFLLNNQELCILQIKYTTSIPVESKVLTQTHIMVRQLGKQNWRWIYISDELKEKDFREFFPNFPKNVVIKELPYTH